MTLKAVRCASCGGAVAAAPGKPLPSCLFCGADAAELLEVDRPEGTEDPVGAIGFAVSDADAREAFVAFAGSSFWYPNDLRNARLELRHLLLPAWAWSGRLETHWTGLVRAATRSGKRPVAGAETVEFDQVLVPASKTLSQAELRSLGAFDEEALASFDPATADDPYELSEVTRSVAREAAQQEMERRHRARLIQANSLQKPRVASVVHELEGRPVLVPVFIGAYRYNDVTYRILVNGQTGALYGRAPRSLWKVVGVVAAVVLAVVGVMVAFAVCSGGLGVLGMLFG